MKRTEYVLILLFFFTQIFSGMAGLGNDRSGNISQKIDYLNKLPSDTKFTQHTVIVKFALVHKNSLSKSSVNLPSLSPIFLMYGVNRTMQMYPSSEQMISSNGSLIDLSRMYRIEYASDANPLDVAKNISLLPEVEYAEPEVIHTISGIPNDPMYAQQWHLQKISAPQGWDITTGDPNVVIAIVDTGVDWHHPDLSANIWINPGEDINHDGKFTQADLNGIDDDHNGYIDDVIGIDFVGKNGGGGGSYYDNDPAPTINGNLHGTHVAGIAAAVGNNGIGGAGVAYNCKIFPVKCTSDLGENNISRGYDGIVYAADMGAKIINCSWGGGGYLKSEQERINYAVSKGALVVAAAGNDGMEVSFSSPASYDDVLSVSNTAQDDKRDASSTYGTWIDVAAPGQSILSTVSNPANGYMFLTGTSMASPCAAGVAALVKTKFPSYTPLQVAEQVRVTSDNIDAKNPGYEHKLGYGRVNLYRALTMSLPAVRMTDYVISDKKLGNKNGIIDPGETLEISLDWKNFLAPTTNAVFKLTTTSNYITVTKADFTLGQLNTNQSISNASDPYIITVHQNIPFNQKIDFVYTIDDGSYKDYGGFSLYARPTYRDHDANDIITTISNDGNLGFDDFSSLKGKGFIYQNNGYNILFEGALMLTGKINNVVHTVDQARDETGSQKNADFVGDNSVIIETPGKVAAQEGFTSWTDNGAPTVDKLGIKTSLHSYEFTNDSERNIIIFRYRFTNTSTSTITNFHAGLFFDWDISSNAYNDKADYDATKQTGYQWDISQINGTPTHVGITVLTRGKPTHWMAINNPDKGSPPGPGFGIHDGFTKDEKSACISSGILQKSSYVTDVSMAMGNGPYTLQPGDSCEVAFAVMAGLTNEQVIASTDKALGIWKRITTPLFVNHEIPEGLSLEQNYPNPFSISSTNNASTSIRFNLPSTAHIKVEVLDAFGRTVAILKDEVETSGAYSVPFNAAELPSGIYFTRLTFGTTVLMRKMLYLR